MQVGARYQENAREDILTQQWCKQRSATRKDKNRHLTGAERWASNIFEDMIPRRMLRLVKLFFNQISSDLKQETYVTLDSNLFGKANDLSPMHWAFWQI